MPDRYITLVVKADQDVVESMQQQLRDGTERGVQLVLAGELTVLGAWATDEDPSAEQRHLIRLEAGGWTLQHSWDCRLRGRLFDCPYNGAAQAAGQYLHDHATRIGAGVYPVELAPHPDLGEERLVLRTHERRPL